jgi:hypothetical protein
MNNDIDNQIIECAQIIRAAVNNETEVTVSRRITISRIQPEPKLYFEIFFGDILNKSQWKWECAQADTLAEAQEKALALIAEQGDERKRELQRLQEAAGKLGLQLVEATQ